MSLRTSLPVQPHLYIGDVTGVPLDYGMVYFGEPNKDPEFYPIDVYYDEAMTVAATQPVRTKGGFMNAFGDMVEIYADEQTYSVKVVDAYGYKVFYKPEMSKTSTGASVSTKQPFANAVVRTQDEKNAETVSIEDFGASTSNADNTTQINNAISYAISSNSDLYFPSGNYSTLGNLPYIHSVSVYGKGVIKKGDDNYYIEPSSTQQNILYVKPSGTGDGLSRDKAMGIPQLVPALRNVQDRAKLGSWRVIFCGGSGAFSADGIRFKDIPAFNNRLEFVGELTSTGLHDTIWDGSTSSEPYAIRADMNSAALRVLIKDIKIINFNSHPTNSGGLVFWGGHNLITENVSVDNCPIGIWTSRNSFHRSIGDKINNCAQWGIACQYNSSVALGESAKRTKITNCKFGLHVGRVSVAHNDYVDYENNDYDLYVTQNSRITHINPTYKGWNIASHYMQNGAIDEAVEVGNYDSNSITDATPILLTENAPVVDIVKGRGLELLHQSQVPTNAAVVTGTTAQTLLSAMDGFNAWLRLPKNILYQGEGLTIRYKAHIQGVNTTDTSEFILHGSGTSASLQLISFPLPNGGYGGFIEVHIDFRKDGAMYVYGSMTTTYGVVYRNKTISPSTADANFRDKTSDLALWRTYLKPAAADDTFTLLSQKTWITL